MSKRHREIRTLLLLFVSACASVGPYDRGEFMDRARPTSIPLPKGTSFKVRQGAFGLSSHSEEGNEFSWDLEVPLGTEVIAVDSGKVIQVYRPPEGEGACDSAKGPYAWNIQVEHADATVAQYVHVDTELKVGAPVERGQTIARTASNGWICYPHLHFGIYRSRIHLYSSPQRETLPLLFEGVEGGLLREGENYKR